MEGEYELRRNLAISLSNAEMALSRSDKTSGHREVRRAYRACHRLTASIYGGSVDDFPEDAVVVSDSRAFRENVSNILGMSGCETEDVSRFEDALSLVSDRDPDLVLADLLVSGTLVTDARGFEDATVVSVFEEEGVPYQAVSGVVSDGDETGYEDVEPVDVAQEKDADAYLVTEEELRERGYDAVREVRVPGRCRVPSPVYLVSDSEVSIVGGAEFEREPLNVTTLLSAVLAAR